MIAARRRSRPFLRSLLDGMMFVAALLFILAGMNFFGWLRPDTGRYAAIDGDSLRKGETEYRLNGIDAPELNQHCSDRSGRDYGCGREARAALRRLVDGKELSCQVRETDRYGRGIATCVAGDVEINGAMVLDGWAIPYGAQGLVYADEEADARYAGRGIWQGNFERPQDWRDRHRDRVVKAGSAADMAVLPD